MSPIVISKAPVRRVGAKPGSSGPRTIRKGTASRVVPMKISAVADEIARGSYGRVVGFDAGGLSNRPVELEGDLVTKQAFDISTVGGCLAVRELDLLLKLRHPNIIPVRGIAFPEPDHDEETETRLDSLSIIFPRAKCNMMSVIGKVSPRCMKILIMDVLLGLEFMHRSGFVHGDIKVQNILIQKRKRLVARIGDMGSARRAYGGDPMAPCVTTYACGAPEQAGTADYNEAIDMWSMGFLVYSLLCNSEPLAFDTKSKQPWSLIILEGMLQHVPVYPTLKEIIQAGFTGRAAESLHRKHRNRPNRTWVQYMRDHECIDFALKVCGSESQIEALIGGLMCFDSRRRMTATQALDLPMFDEKRAWISRARREYPALSKKSEPRFERMTHREESAHIKAVMLKSFEQSLSNEFKMHGYYRASPYITGLALMDRYIDIHRKNMKTPVLDQVEAVFLSFICLHLGHKYHVRHDVYVPEAENVFSPRFNTPEYIRRREEIEQAIVSSFLDGNMDMLTTYDDMDRYYPRTIESLTELYRGMFI